MNIFHSYILRKLIRTHGTGNKAPWYFRFFFLVPKIALDSAWKDATRYRNERGKRIIMNERSD